MNCTKYRMKNVKTRHLKSKGYQDDLLLMFLKLEIALGVVVILRTEFMLRRRIPSTEVIMTSSQNMK